MRGRTGANGKKAGEEKWGNKRHAQKPAAFAHISLVRRSGRRRVEVVVQTVEIVRHASRAGKWEADKQKMDLRAAAEATGRGRSGARQ